MKDTKDKFYYAFLCGEQTDYPSVPNVVYLLSKRQCRRVRCYM